MKEYRIGNAIVRVRGKVDKKRIQEATDEFMKKVDKQREEKKQQKEEPLS